MFAWTLCLLSLISSTCLAVPYAFTDLITGCPGCGPEHTIPTDINNAGVVVGHYGSRYHQSFIYESGAFRDVPQLGANTIATSINDGGEIVGYFAVGLSGFIRGFVTTTSGTPLTPIDAPPPPGCTAPPICMHTILEGINNEGEMVGWSLAGPLRYDGMFHPLTVPGLPDARVFDINNRGDMIVGPPEHAGWDFGGSWLYRNGTLTHVNLGTLLGINNLGVAAGSYVDSSGRRHGFLWNEGKITTVDVPGSLNTVITGQNDRGELVGFYESPSTEYVTGFVAHPIPEPGTLIYLLVAAVAGCAWHRALNRHRKPPFRS